MIKPMHVHVENQPAGDSKHAEACEAVNRLRVLRTQPDKLEPAAIKKLIIDFEVDEAVYRLFARAMNRLPVPLDLVERVIPRTDDQPLDGVALAVVATATWSEVTECLVRVVERDLLFETSRCAVLRATILYAAWIFATRRIVSPELKKRIIAQARWSACMHRGNSGAATFYRALGGEANDPYLIDLLDRESSDAIDQVLRKVGLDSSSGISALQHVIFKLGPEVLEAYVRSTRKALAQHIALETSTTPKNGPCSCGSGNKYKRCCGDPEKKTASAPRLRRNAAEYTVSEINSMTIAACAKVTEQRGSSLTSPALAAAIERLTARRAWEQIDVALAVYAGRKDVTDEVFDERRIGAASLASGAHEFERAKAYQALRAGTQQVRYFRTALQLEEALGNGDKARAFDLLIEAARTAVTPSRASEGTAVSLTTVGLLLKTIPELGLWLVRGALSLEYPYDSKVILDGTEPARALLGLSNTDPAWDRYMAQYNAAEALERSERAQSEAATAKETAEAKRVEAERELRVATRRVTELNAKVGQLEAELAMKATPAVTVEGTEVRVLRDRIDALSAQLKESNQQKAQLRRELTLATGITFDSSEYITPRPAILTQNVADLLQELPQDLQRQVLRRKFELEVGDPSAWRKVKPVEGVTGSQGPILMTPAGDQFIFLFEKFHTALELYELIARDDLPKVIQQLQSHAPWH